MRLTLLLLLFSVPALASEIYDVSTQRYISYETLLKELPSNATFVLGEYHYQPSIHKAQAELIEKLAAFHKVQFTVAWEFLDHRDDKRIQKVIQSYKQGGFGDHELLRKLFHSAHKPLQNLPYLPIFQVVKKAGAQFIGVNASRITKQKIIRTGLNSIDSNLIPKGFVIGGQHYFDRFRAAMGGHVPDHNLKQYFLAQSFSDDVMAWKIEEFSNFPLRFLIVGGFHSDYKDGVSERIRIRSSSQTVTVKFLEKSLFSKKEIKKMLLPDPKYGPIADYVFLTQGSGSNQNQQKR